MIQNTLGLMIGVGISALVAGVAVSTYKHYYEKYADLEDREEISDVQEVVLVSETTEVEE